MKRTINLLILIALLALSFHATGTASAASPTNVLSNIPSNIDGAGSLAPDLQRAVGFTTGLDWYALSSVSIAFKNWSLTDQTVNAWLYTDNGGNPGNALTAFTSILSPVGEDTVRVLSLATPYVLSPNTTYWIVVDSNATTWGDAVWYFSDILPTGIFSYAGSRQNVSLAGWASEPNDFMWSLQAIPLSQVSAVGTNADGYIIESGENTSLGGVATTLGGTLTVGDQTLDRQVRAFVNFNNPSLPIDAVIVGVKLQIKRQGFTGTNPLTTHGNLWVDLASPQFGPEAALKRGDFQAASSLTHAGVFDPSPATGNWYNAIFDPSSFSYFSLPGAIQLRLAFNLEDNDDRGADLLRFFSGDYANASYRPVLTIYYYIPGLCAPSPDAPFPPLCAPTKE